MYLPLANVQRVSAMGFFVVTGITLLALSFITLLLHLLYHTHSPYDPWHLVGGANGFLLAGDAGRVR